MKLRIIGVVLLLGVSLTGLQAQYKSPWDVQADLNYYKARASLLSNHVPLGIIVRTVPVNSGAANFGLHLFDVITKVGDIPTVDTDSYVRARDAAARSKDPETPIVIWRGTREITLKGLVTSPFGPTIEEYDGTLETIFDNFEKAKLDAAKAVLESAEADHLLSRKHLLIAKLVLAPDVPIDSSEERIQLATELRELVKPHYDQIDIWRKLADHYSENAAAFLLEKYVKENDDPNAKLNLGLTLARAHRNEEADKIANYYIDPQSNVVGSTYRNVSAYGLYVAHWIRSETAENRGDFEQAWNEHIAAVASSANHLNDDVMRGLFLAAKLKDHVRFEVARQYAKVLPTTAVAPYLDSLDAYLLVETDEPKARQLVVKWKDKPEEIDILVHWRREFPEVLAVWQKLR